MAETYVESGQVVSNAHIYAGDIQHINSGGIAKKNIVFGSQLVSSGGKTISTTLEGDHATQYLYSGGIASSTTLIGYCCTQYISGGVAKNTIINNGNQYVYSGSVKTTTINSGGSQFVTGGVVSATTINNGGSQEILGDGIAYETTVNSGGLLYVNCVAENVKQAVGGNVRVYVEGNDTTKVTGSNASGTFYYSNSVASNFIIYQNGTLSVGSGGIAKKTTVSSGGEFRVFDGGTAINTKQKVGGDVLISVTGNGTAKVTGTNASGAFYYSNGVASNFIIYNNLATLYNKGFQVTSGGVAYGTTISGGGIMVYHGGTVINTIANNCLIYVQYDGVASKTTINNSGRVYVSSGGVANVTTVNSGGDFNVDGVASATTINNGGYQNVFQTGIAYATTINSGGLQGVYSGVTSATTINNGGSQYAFGDFIVYATTINSGGSQRLVDGVASATTINSGGMQALGGIDRSGGLYGGEAYNTTIKAGGTQQLEYLAKAYNTKINSGGCQIVGEAFEEEVEVGSNGYAEGTIVSKGGKLILNGGGVVSAATIQASGLFTLNKGGKATGVIINSGGKEIVSAGATDTSAKVAGTMTVAGTAKKLSVRDGGKVTATGKVTSATINNGGKLTLKNAAKATALILKEGGSLIVSNGATASMKSIASGGKLSLKSGGTLNLTSANILYGKNSFTGATVTGGTKDKRVSLAEKATLTVGTNTTMKKLHLNASNATISVTGTGNTLGSLQNNKSTAVCYDISKLKASATAYMFALSTKNTQKLGKFSVNVKKNQGVGTYELSKNFVQAKNTNYTINLAGKKQGIAKLNGLGLIKNTAIYTVNSKSNAITLTVAKTGSTLKGTAKADKLTGTTNWDVFYGGKGNDTITGKNGRDVAVYDKTSWGKDTIAKTSGTMTLLFKDLTSKDIKKSLSSSTMTITKKNDSRQTITVKNWSDSTHSIVFGSKMTAFDKFIKAASPTTAQTTAAKNEAFKKAGLASA